LTRTAIRETHGLGSGPSTASLFFVDQDGFGDTLRDAGYTIALHLTDDTSAASGTVSFHGVFNGELSILSGYPSDFLDH
jgi:hypothetical protein